MGLEESLGGHKMDRQENLENGPKGRQPYQKDRLLGWHQIRLSKDARGERLFFGTKTALKRFFESIDSI